VLLPMQVKVNPTEIFPPVVFTAFPYKSSATKNSLSNSGNVRGHQSVTRG